MIKRAYAARRDHRHLGGRQHLLESLGIGSLHGAVTSDLGHHECGHASVTKRCNRFEEVLAGAFFPPGDGNVGTPRVEANRNLALGSKLTHEVRVLDSCRADHHPGYTGIPQPLGGFDRADSPTDLQRHIDSFGDGCDGRQVLLITAAGCIEINTVDPGRTFAGKSRCLVCRVVAVDRLAVVVALV